MPNGIAAHRSFGELNYDNSKRGMVLVGLVITLGSFLTFG